MKREQFDKQTSTLALARAGATGFALAEYERLGLGNVTELDDKQLLEDCLSLGGRLYKDLYLSHSGEAARDYATQASGRYETAFQKTGGFYSGINSATMALLAGASETSVGEQAQNILNALPDTENTDSETRYYIEATRAEAYYLLNQIGEAHAALESAVDHDPLNYTAHATTLKQLGMIASHRGEDQIWTRAYAPPRAVHFSGHMFGIGEGVSDLPHLSQKETDTVGINISDTLQRHDVGYGYGALAAGADILIAEALLREGCELHIILPVPEEEFIAASVAPYGPEWVERFNWCKENSTSFNIAASDVPWPLAKVDEYASRIAMGRARLRAQSLAAPCGDNC